MRFINQWAVNRYTRKAPKEFISPLNYLLFIPWALNFFLRYFQSHAVLRPQGFKFARRGLEGRRGHFKSFFLAIFTPKGLILGKNGTHSSPYSEFMSDSDKLPEIPELIRRQFKSLLDRAFLNRGDKKGNLKCRPYPQKCLTGDKGACSENKLGLTMYEFQVAH